MRCSTCNRRSFRACYASNCPVSNNLRTPRAPVITSVSAKPTKYSAEKALIADLLAQGLPVTEVASRAGVPITTVYSELKKNKEIKALRSNAKQIAAFKVKTVMQGECRVWVGAQSPNECGNAGYMRFQGKVQPANRVAWYLAGRTIPEGKLLHNTCKNPLCTTVSHWTL